MISEHKSTHSSQINTSFPAIILKTSLVFFPQKEHLTSSFFLTIITPHIIELFLYLIIFLLSNRYKAQKDTHYYNILYLYLLANSTKNN